MKSLSGEVTVALIGAIAVVAAAIIGGIVAFITLIVNKEQSVSAFRQTWVDELRKDVAKLVAHVIGAHGTSVTQERSEKELWDRIKSDFVGMSELIVRIRLRLNPRESRKKEGSATKNILAALSGIERTFESASPNFVKLREHTDALVDNAQKILKENWNRVRVGEPIYVVTKWATLVIALGALVASMIYLAIR